MHFWIATTGSMRRRLFLKSETGEWILVTSSYVLHESWALIQARLGWDAVEDFLRETVVRCRIVWVDERNSLAQRGRGKPGNAVSA